MRDTRGNGIVYLSIGLTALTPDARYTWQLHGKDGRVLCESRPYKTKTSCKAGLEWSVRAIGFAAREWPLVNR